MPSRTEAGLDTPDHSHLDVGGTSVAGVETCVEVPAYRLALDMGVCSRSAVALSTVLVSHGHLDHCGALPQHAARRAMMGMSPGTYVVPAAVAPQVEALFNACQLLDGGALPRTVIPLESGARFALGKGREVEAFATQHRVPSQGYVVVEHRQKLKDLYRHLSGAEVAALKRSGTVVTQSTEVPTLAFTGDTRVEGLEASALARRAQTLVMEVSFLDEQVSVDQAREMGHIHLDEVLDRPGLLGARRVIFSHFSARYLPDDVVRILERRLPEGLSGVVQPLLPRAGGAA